MTISVSPTPITAQAYPSTAPDLRAPGPHGRPAGDTRSEKQIFKDNPILKDVLKQNGPFANNFLDQLKKQTGDWSPANPDPDSRADAAYKLADVTSRVKSHPSIKRQDPAQQNDQHIHGFGQFGSVSAGSEAQLLKAFSEKGYSALQ